MREFLIAGNWKMHGSSAFVAEFAGKWRAASVPERVQVLLLPPAPYIRELAAALRDVPIDLGVQNVHSESEGAFTGEISAEMARDLGAAWCLAGHSERRSLFGESDDMAGQKVKAALRAGIAPLLCVGESLEERDAGSAEAVVRRQLAAAAAVTGAAALLETTLAYEPVWAIGTGRTASPQQAQEMHAVIRKQVAELCGDDAAQRIRILYGGSVKADNAAALLGQADIDGVLVGGASLDAAQFARIVSAAAP
ncbi:MAG: triose-phosphate isomerase [Pseudomonadales bacterium]